MTTPACRPRLRCAHLVNPLGVAPDRVRFSWRLAERRQCQASAATRSGCSERAAAAGQRTAPAWDSGRVTSARLRRHPVRGPPLARGGRYAWRVRVWDEAGAASAWSEPASFEVELDPASGWQASWIGLARSGRASPPPAKPGPSDPVARALHPAPYLRRAFSVDKPVASARLYVTALGLYEARLNGHRVGDASSPPAGPTTPSGSRTRPTT